MKTSILKTFLLILTVSLLLLVSQSGCKHPAVKVADPSYAMWFKVKNIADHVWAIDEQGIANFYLVEGSDTALLIDNGTGAVNVRDFIASLTSLPLVVVNTHGHPDHGGANYQFPTVYAHPADFSLLADCNTSEHRWEMERNMLRGKTIPAEIRFTDTLHPRQTVLKPVREGYIFNLGNRKLEVIEVPGHTAGSICLLDAQHKMLFSGDNNNTFERMSGTSCEPLETYLKSLQHLTTFTKEFDTIYPGHGKPIDKAFIGEEISCIEDILHDSGQLKPYYTPSGENAGFICTYKRASVVYNKANLWIKK